MVPSPVLVSCSSEYARGLHPAMDILLSFPFPLALPVFLKPGCSSFNHIRSSVGLVPCKVDRHPTSSHRRHPRFCVIQLVLADCIRVPSARLRQLRCRSSLRLTARRRALNNQHQPVSVSVTACPAVQRLAPIPANRTTANANTVDACRVEMSTLLGRVSSQNECVDRCKRDDNSR